MASSENHLLCPVKEWAALAGKLLQREHTVRLRVRGWSMHPAIRNGEIVWIVPSVSTQLAMGQVVLYLESSGRPSIHRIIRKQRGHGVPHYYVGSDRMPKVGEWVPASRVLGRVVGVERAGRHVAMDGWRGRLWACFFLTLRPLRPWINRLRKAVRGSKEGSWNDLGGP